LASVVLLAIASTFLTSFILFYPPIYIVQNNPLPNECISSDQAYQIALPYIVEYAKENNRFICGIGIEFWNASKDFSGMRGNSSLSYPIWVVKAGFEKPLFINENCYGGYPYGIFGIEVLIWADNGQISFIGFEGVL
jgi:hypothetical protein